MKYLILAVSVFGVEFALAQSPTPAVAGAIDHLASFIPSGASMLIVAIVGFLGEMILRLWPTAKPQSIAIWISSVLKSLAGLFEKLSKFLDGFVQNLKDGGGK